LYFPGTPGDQTAINPASDETTIFSSDHSNAGEILDSGANSSESEEPQILGNDISSPQPSQTDDLPVLTSQDSGFEIDDNTAFTDFNQSSSSSSSSEHDNPCVINNGDGSIFTSMCTENMCHEANIPSSEYLTPEALNTPLVPSLSVTKFETLLMIFHLAMRHGMTGVFLEDMLKFTNTLVGDDNAIPGSKYVLVSQTFHVR